MHDRGKASGTDAAHCAVSGCAPEGGRSSEGGHQRGERLRGRRGSRTHSPPQSRQDIFYWIS